MYMEQVTYHTHSGTDGSPRIQYTDIDGTPDLSAYAQETSFVNQSQSSTATINYSSGSKHQITLTGNVTLSISNMTPGKIVILRLLQDGTGSRTVTWFSTIKWPGAVTPTLTTTASKADVFGFICTGTDTYDGFVIGQNL